MFEAQLGALRDIDFGIYPVHLFLLHHCCIRSHRRWHSRIRSLSSVVGIMKAYSTCVGAGPFTCELFGDERRGSPPTPETNTARRPARPRRVGGFDVVASRYGIMMQGATEIALTKLDVLSFLDRIPVCVKYDVNGTLTHRFPDRRGA